MVAYRLISSRGAGLGCTHNSERGGGAMRAALLNSSYEVDAPAVVGSDHAWREQVQTAERWGFGQRGRPRDGPGLECIEGRGTTVASALRSRTGASRETAAAPTVRPLTVYALSRRQAVSAPPGNPRRRRAPACRRSRR